MAAQYERLPVTRQEIFALDVTELSDRLDVTEVELLSGLSVAAARSPASTCAESRREPVSRGTLLDYVVCLIVSGESGNFSSAVLELNLRRLLDYPHCKRVIVCVLGERLHDEAAAIVKRCKRATTFSVPTTIDLLQGRNCDEGDTLQHACMYLEASAPSPRLRHSAARSRPLVVIRLSTRVFELKAIDELVSHLQNVSSMTNGTTRAVALVDSAADARVCQVPVGIWVCSHEAVRLIADGHVKIVRDRPEQQSDNDGVLIPNTVDQWLPNVIGPLQCENVIATPEFNWEELITDDDSKVKGKFFLRHRFEEPQHGFVVDVECAEENQVCSDMMEFPEHILAYSPSSATLLALQSQLSEDGINAGLFPIHTKVSFEPEDDTVKPARQLSERTPLLLNASVSPARDAHEATVLSELDLDEANRGKGASTNAHAFLIQVEHPADAQYSSSNRGCQSTGSTTTELILALPNELNEIISHDGEDSSDDELDELPQALLRRHDRLPSGVKEVSLEALIVEPPVKSGFSTKRVSVILHVEKQVPLVGYFILMIALCAVSSQGAVLDFLVDVPPLLKLFWRMSGASLAFLPFATVSMYRKGYPKLSRHKKMLFMCCAIAYTTYNATFLISLSLTSIGHVYIFSNSHSLIMVAGKLLLRQPLGVLELMGAALGFSGGVVTTTDHGPTELTSERTSHTSQPSTTGDFVAFAGAFAGVAYLMSAKKLRATLGVRVFLFCLVTAVWTLLLPVLLWNHDRLGIDLSNPTHPQRGLFGWVHHFGIEAYVVLVGSMCGTMGFIASMKYFEPLVVSVTMLTEPVVATIISVLLGVEGIPGWPTFLGGGAVILGCLLVLLASHKTSTRIDVSDRLVKTPFASAVNALRSEPSHQRRHSAVQPMSMGAITFRTNYGSLP